MSYSTEALYQNDIVAGFLHKITLEGQMLTSDFGYGGSFGASSAMQYLNDVFSSNGHLLEIDEIEPKGMQPILLANDIIVRSISFNESPNNWTQYINYTVELESMNLLTGRDLTQALEMIRQGSTDARIIANMGSPFMVNMDSYHIKDWNEQFDIQTGENQITRTTIAERKFDYGEDIESTPIDIVTTMGGEYFTITYSITATGKQKMFKTPANNFNSNEAKVLPAWEHAKRFVHTTLINKMSGLFGNFLSMNGNVTRENLGAQNGNGAFGSFIDNHRNNNFSYPSYGLYNEHVSFDVSESAGTFSATYNAIIKRHCPTELTNGQYEENPAGDRSESRDDMSAIYTYDTDYVYPCYDHVLHTVTKTVDKTYEANEYPTIANVVNSITINGTITGLVPGGIMNPQSRIKINSLPTGSFLCYNTDITHPNTGDIGGVDKSYHANIAFDRIFDYNRYDLRNKFKYLLGVTPYALGVSPTATMRPSSMNITRDLMSGTVTYSATYDTKYNCDPNNFEINVSTNESVPVMGEFVIPNNNTRDINGDVCETGLGFSAIQLLGTFTPKTIDVSINASVSADFNKCCLGTSENWNLFDYDFLRMEGFILPSGMNIPYVSDKYVLTKQTKSVSYPAGDMSFSLSYVCADICEIRGYFTDTPNGN